LALFFAALVSFHKAEASEGNGTSKIITNAMPSGMVLDLGEVSDNIKVTPEYSNAVFQAILPYFSDVAKRLDLPGTQQITANDVLEFRVMPFGRATCSTRLKDGRIFSFAFGFVNSYSSPRSPLYPHVQPDPKPSASHRLMTKEEALQEVRDCILKLGVSLADVFADMEPTVTTYPKPFTNSVVRYRMRWKDPYGGPAADFIINPATQEIERFSLGGMTNLRRPVPHLSVEPSPADAKSSLFLSQIPPQRINPEYARQLVPMIFDAVDGYARKLSLPIPLPLTTNNVARIKIYNNDGWPHCEVWLTNGWKFIYRHTMVNGYHTPNVFNTTDYHPFHQKDFGGNWNLTTNQAIDLVKQQLAKLDFPTSNIHMDFAPNVIYAAGDFKKIIPRYFFEWDYTTNEELLSKVEAEVNANSGKLESLYYDDKAYWGSYPPIDVPISAEK
jgi:hypothetical protein